MSESAARRVSDDPDLLVWGIPSEEVDDDEDGVLLEGGGAQGEPPTEEDDLNMNVSTPEDTPDGPRAPPPLIPLPDSRPRNRPAPGGKPAEIPGGAGPHLSLGQQLLNWLKERGLLEAEDPSQGRKPSGKGRRGG